MKDTSFYPKLAFNFKGILRTFDRPIVMGILNATPDSFFSASRVKSSDELMKRVATMIRDGADILDIGGYSSRPGATDITESEELDRVVSVISKVHQEFPDVILSIDTFRSNVADTALSEGAAMINDISGGVADNRILHVASDHGVPFIIMHMRGTPQTMAVQTNYSDILKEMRHYFELQISSAKAAGVKDIILDPGFGFSKTLDQNFTVLKNLDVFSSLGYPLLAGVSRKSMIQKSLGVSAEESLNGTTVVNTLALSKGASILRVHDVKEAKQAVELFSRMNA